MNPERWELVAKIFDAALDQPPSAREDFVQQGCKGDEELEGEVLRLLAADEQAGSFLERQPFSITETAQAAATSSPLATGTTLAGRFKILRFIGQGGMGQVYEALDLELKARVALKTIRPDISSDPRMLSRFRREVQLTHRITHPNVCRIFDIDRHTPCPKDGTDRDITFLTMELLEGETLADFLSRRGRLSTAEALPLVAQMIGGMSAAHAVGIVHRDFKPLNVLLVPASGSSSAGLRLVVTDFGLARAARQDAQVSEQAPSFATEPAGLMGTPIYMAPEQIERGEATVASDIYSLGLVMYEMVTGHRPFADPIRSVETTKRIKQPAPTPRLLVPDMDPAWETAIIKCLEMEPGQRFQSVLLVAEEIAMASRESDSLSSSPQSHLTRPQGRVSNITSRWKWAIGIALLLAALALFAVGLRHYRRANPIQFAERDWILVADFTNQTGEKVFDRVVRDLTVQSLSQSTYVNIVPRLSAIEAAKRTGLKDTNSIDEKLGRELCLRENYGALLSGEILRNGSAYILTMRVTVPDKSDAVISDAESFQSPNELFASIDKLTTRMRQKLGESLSSIQSSSKALAQVTTPLLAALQRYSTAVDLYGAWEYTRCINLAKDAIDRDPNFAMAHLLLAKAYEQMGNEEMFKEQLNLATAASDRVSEREKYLILAENYSSQLMNEKAADEYQHLLDIFPDDIDGLKGYAYEAFWAGHAEQAIAAQRKVLSYGPNDINAYDALMSLLVKTNRFGEALTIYNQAVLRKLQGANLVYLAALASWGTGDILHARELLDSLSDQGSTYWKVLGRLSVGRLLAFQGRMTEAQDVFRAGLALVQMPGFENWIPVFQFHIASAAITTGNIANARTECVKYRQAAVKAPIAMNLERGASLFLRVGDVGEARSFQIMARQQVEKSPDPFSEMEMHALTGAIELASHNPEAAIREEQASLSFRSWYTPYFALGLSCETARNWDCAIKAYEQYLNFKGAILSGDASENWVMGHYSLARTYFEAGDTASGDAQYQQFLTLFSAADSGLPILARAKNEVAHWHRLGSAKTRQP